jgi:hypothetical protein
MCLCAMCWGWVRFNYVRMCYVTYAKHIQQIRTYLLFLPIPANSSIFFFFLLLLLAIIIIIIIIYYSISITMIFSSCSE